jgi:ketosteroid isomerase-like protein
MLRQIFLLPLLVLALAGLGRARGTDAYQADSEVEKEILKLESERDQAMIKGDIATLDRIFADDYFWVSVNGTIHVKAERLADLRSGAVKYESFKQDNYRLHTYPDTVVMIGRATSPVQYHERVNSNPRQFTNVYVKQNGRWQLVVHQSTPIAEQSEASTSTSSTPAGSATTRVSNDENASKQEYKNGSESPLSISGKRSVASQANAEIEEEILKVEHDKDQAMQNRDMALLDRIYADDLTFVNARGQVLTKAQRMDEVRSGRVKYLSSLDKSDSFVHVYGGTVILTARENSPVEYHGKVISSPRRFVTVYVKLDGQWKYVAHQATPISEHYFDSLPLRPGKKQ